MIVKFNRPRMLGILNGEITLRPGLNTVADALWERAKKDKFILAKIEDEEIEEIETAGEKSPVEKLLKMAEKKAVKLVAETTEPALLGEWVGKEKRPKVLAALQAQIKELSEIPLRDGKTKTVDPTGGAGKPAETAPPADDAGSKE